MLLSLRYTSIQVKLYFGVRQLAAAFLSCSQVPCKRPTDRDRLLNSAEHLCKASLSIIVKSMRICNLQNTQKRSISPLEPALIKVFILNNLKFFRMNTYEKHSGEGGVMVNQKPGDDSFPDLAQRLE